LGAVQADLNLEYAHTAVFFECDGFDETHEVRESGSAIPEEDGTLEIGFAYRNGDEATLKAPRT
jgi:hypothetical protein